MNKTAMAGALGLFLFSTSAAADEPVLQVGARVGGYGFRQAPTPERDHTGWEACRMNGLGLFGEHRLSRHFFVEGGLDAYFADDLGTGGDPMPENEWRIDRVSTLASVSGGAYLLPGARVSPYVQLGLGLELTRVTVGGGANAVTEDFVLPMGFFGIGADVRVGPARLGASLRVNAMGYFDNAAGTTSLEPEAELATQGQFYAKFAL